MKQIKPMGAIALPVDKRNEYLLDVNHYIAERKYDGSRYILQITSEGEIYLTSRKESVKGGQVDKTKNVPQIIDDVRLLPKGTILDGEIDIRSEDRNFKYVQGIMGSKPELAIQRQDTGGLLVYKTFDILEYKGEDLRSRTLRERKEILNKIFEEYNLNYLIKVDIHIKEFKEFFDAEVARGAEGIMLKNLDSIYQEGKEPSKTWYKIKAKDTYDGIVMGYDYGNPGSKYEKCHRTLRVYQYCEGVLLQVADVGGISEKNAALFKERLDKEEQFCIEFEAYGLFKDTHRYRHPSFKRLREDKNPQDCKYGHA